MMDKPPPSVFVDVWNGETWTSQSLCCFYLTPETQKKLTWPPNSCLPSIIFLSCELLVSRMVRGKHAVAAELFVSWPKMAEWVAVFSIVKWSFWRDFWQDDVCEKAAGQFFYIYLKLMNHLPVRHDICIIYIYIYLYFFWGKMFVSLGVLTCLTQSPPKKGIFWRFPRWEDWTDFPQKSGVFFPDVSSPLHPDDTPVATGEA